MKSQIADLTYAKIFLSTITFKTWQKFCDGRSHFKISSQTNIKIKSRPPTQKDLKKYIIPAKTFQTWLKTYKLRTKISNFLTGKLKTILIRYVPKSTRLQLKKSLNILTCFSDSGVSTMIALEWQTWMQRRQNGSLDIIIFGITSFDYRFQRPQQLAYALANLGHRIFYIESEFNFVGNQSRSGVQIRKEAKNIFVVKLSALENYFIYKDFPTVQGRAILFKSLKKLFKLARIINPVAKIDHPFWGSIAQSLKMPLIYDAMDLHSGFPETGKSIEKYERELTSVSDLILTSSDYIQKEFLKFKQKSLMVRNAGDFYHFSKAKNKMVKPIDLMEFSGKIIGYYGAISDWMDDKIIKQLAINCPDVEIVIIGRVQNQKLVELAQVYLNIHLLGEKPYQELPNYLSYFDVCLIPFKITNLI
ncbi:MAG TPA: hypothetical protein DEP87_01870, partial [Candidatus Pacebacteria bacterium]|nr:hypothetical protein [Candidatus Paceibacterota bacterium]